MAQIWSERYRRKLWRRLWVALADAQCEAGVVTPAQVEDLRCHQADVDLERARKIEAVCRHELMAEVRVFAEQCPVGGKILHLGATTTDIQDNAEVLRVRESLALIESRLSELLITFAEQIERFANVPSIGLTHLQAAEPTTIGYRLAQYGQDLMHDLADVRRVRGSTLGKGLRGAVGTSASFTELLGQARTAAVVKPSILEERFMASVELSAHAVTTQTYPRKQDWRVVSALAGVAASLHRFALDLRILQSPGIAEWYEPATADQISSSAMPFKRNPCGAEAINSLARFVAVLPRVMWDNAAQSMLERTLDDSANSREVLPTAFLATDEILLRARHIVGYLEIDTTAVARNLERHQPLAGLERVLLACCIRGGDRQQLHDTLRRHVWETRQDVDGDRSLRNRLITDSAIRTLLSPDEVDDCLGSRSYLGDAEERARRLAAALREACRE
jgi:adenylosuccinate lyase